MLAVGKLAAKSPFVRKAAGRYTKQAIGGKMKSVTQSMQRAKQKAAAVSNQAKGAAQKVKNAATNAQQKAKGAAQKVKSAATNAKQKAMWAKQGLENLPGDAREKLQNAKYRAQEAARRTTKGARRLLNRTNANAEIKQEDILEAVEARGLFAAR